jgi:hypothetical protein
VGRAYAPDVGTIEGKDWLQKRLEFLEKELGRTRDEVDRVVIQAEIDVVAGDLRRKRRKRGMSWILGFRLPHEQD